MLKTPFKQKALIQGGDLVLSKHYWPNQGGVSHTLALSTLKDSWYSSSCSRFISSRAFRSAWRNKIEYTKYV